MKTKNDKKVNKIVKQLNKDLKEDVFKDRFWYRQYQKARVDGLDYYLYELKDRVDPSRDKVLYHWYSAFEVIGFHKLVMEMNDFIINSNFWELYWKEKDK